MRRLSYIAGTPDDGHTVEYILLHRLHLAPGAIRHAKFQPDGIAVNRLRARSTDHVSKGQTVSVVVGDSMQALERSQVRAVPGPLNIVYEDDDIIVINKPAGLVMHPSSGHHDDTMGNFLCAHFASTDSHAGFHPMHRLDKGTSGLVVVATNPHAQDRLQRKLHTPDFQRTYLAICIGCPDPIQGVIDKPIGLGPEENGLNTRTICNDGKQALTHYKVIQSIDLNDCITEDNAPANEKHSLVQLQLDTGRTHQIRIHMASIGCPLLGDSLYGTGSESITRPALHSSHLELVHPVTEERLAFDAPLPDDMQRFSSFQAAHL